MPALLLRNKPGRHAWSQIESRGTAEYVTEDPKYFHFPHGLSPTKKVIQMCTIE